MDKNELQRIVSALDAQDPEGAIGAFRLMAAGGRLGEIPAAIAARLGPVLENNGLWREAIGLYREVYENHPGSEDAARLCLRAAIAAATAAELPSLAGELASVLSRQGTEEIRNTCRRLLLALGQKDYAQLATLAKTEGIQLPESWSTAVAAPAAAVTTRPASRDQGAGWKEFTKRKKGPAGLNVALIVAAAFAACWLAGGFMDERLSGVDELERQILADPLQRPLDGAVQPFHTRRGEYNLTLYPRYSYRICGLVVSVNDYAMLGLRYQDFFSRDFCMVWGQNVTSHAFKAPGSSFEHHGNVCYFKYSGPVRIRNDQLSNTHIFPANEQVEAVAESVKTGDQICLEGKLVDVSVVPASFDGPGLPPAPQKIQTSTTRTDKGVGACEILYLERIEVLRRANRFWRVLGFLGFWGMVFAVVLVVLLVVQSELAPGRREANR